MEPDTPIVVDIIKTIQNAHIHEFPLRRHVWCFIYKYLIAIFTADEIRAAQTHPHTSHILHEAARNYETGVEITRRLKLDRYFLSYIAAAILYNCPHFVIHSTRELTGSYTSFTTLVERRMDKIFTGSGRFLYTSPPPPDADSTYTIRFASPPTDTPMRIATF